jgi:hypothetical protein
MRHFLPARPVATRPCRMGEPSPAAGLVAPSGGTHTVKAGLWRTIAGAIDVPSVAVAADQHLVATTGAHVEPGRCRAVIVASADITWTSATIAAILAPHACPARCGARRRAKPPSSGRRRACPLIKANLDPPCATAPAGVPCNYSRPQHFTNLPPRSRRALVGFQFCMSPDLRGFRPPSTGNVSTTPLITLSAVR